MALKKKRKILRKVIKPAGPCPFCKGKKTPDYKDYKELAKFLTDRAKIISSAYTGVCSKHQRVLSREIKRARHLGLLPFAPSVD